MQMKTTSQFVASAQDYEQSINIMRLSVALKRYTAELLATGSYRRSTPLSIGAICKSPIGDMALSKITKSAVREYVAERLKHVGPIRVGEDLRVMRRTFHKAQIEWGLKRTDNPMMGVALPPQGKPRTRAITQGEIEAICDALADSPVARTVIALAIETAMTRGQLLALKWRDVSLPHSIIRLPASTRAKRQRVLLNDAAVTILRGIGPGDGRVFLIKSVEFSRAWNEACRVAGIEGVRFHDGRNVLRRVPLSAG